MLEKDIQEILFTEEQLKNRVGEIARQIESDYAGKEVMFIGILRGSWTRPATAATWPPQVRTGSTSR